MIHNNGAFQAIKGNPTTNYCITPDDEIREKIHRTSAMISGKSWPPHESYLGERAVTITICK